VNGGPYIFSPTKPLPYGASLNLILMGKRGSR
jgi:hypothetical protein